MIGERLKIFRLREGLSQKDFAKRLGVVQSVISNCENGRRSLTETYLKLIASEFDVNINWLKNGEGEMYKINSIGINTDVEVKEISNELYNLDNEHRSIVLNVVRTLKEELFKLQKADA